MEQRYRPCGAYSCCYTDDRNTVNSFRDEAHKLRERIADQEEEIKMLRKSVRELEGGLSDLISCFSRDDVTSPDWVCTLNDAEREAIKVLLSTGRGEG